jgi:two-component system, chemotaxis family, chemotaxis protein CheY
MDRILIVDDSPSTRALMRGILSQLDVDVEEARSGFEGIKALPRGGYQLVITDINMPDIHGLEFIRMMRHSPAYGQLPVLVVSTQAESRDVARALSLGANAFLKKPFTAEELLAQVRALLASGGAGV